jgi:hypothetical protein
MVDGIDPKEFFGPLFPLIGTWEGDKGTDVSPEKVGEEITPYFETITIEPVGDAKNADEQTLVVLFYKQVVTNKATQKGFHHQIGYWYFDKSNGELMYSLTIPRAVSVLARGSAKEDGGRHKYSVASQAGSENFGIVQSEFMSKKAKTLGFKMDVEVSGDTLTYSMLTDLHIYGRAFSHTDKNQLTRK